jgi:hypothetical protein
MFNLLRVNYSFLYILSFLIFFVLALSSIYPPIRALTFFNYLWPLLMFSWIIIAYLARQNFFRQVTTHSIVVSFFFVYTIFIAYLSGNGFIGNRFLEYSQIILFYIAYKFYYDKNHNIILILLLSPFLIITSYITLSEFFNSSMIARLSKKDTDAGIEYMMNGIGGYDFIYALTFIIIILFFTLFYKNVKNKLLIFLITLLFLFTVLLSNFTIALILLFIGLLFRIVLPKISYSLLIIYIILILFMLPIVPNIIAFFIDTSIDLFFENSMNAARLLEIKEAILYGIFELSFSERIEAYKYSISALLENPLFGAIFNVIKKTSDGVIGFGQHSFILDTFALYGFSIGLIQVYIYMQPLYIRMNNRIANNSSITMSILVVSFLFLCLNNLTPAVGLVLFFIYPTILDFLTNITIKTRLNKI